MFVVYVNDITEGVGSYISLFIDDAKLLSKISNHNDSEELQNDIDIWMEQDMGIGNECKKISCTGLQSLIWKTWDQTPFGFRNGRFLVYMLTFFR